MVKRRIGFTLVELLVVIAIIGILIALLLPAVQAARESARRTQCTNNLHQIAIALHTYEDSRGTLPPSKYNRLTGGATWAVLILPYLEQSTAYELWDLSKQYATTNVATEQTDAARQTRINAFFCPSRRDLNQLTTQVAGQGGAAGSGGMGNPLNFKPGQVSDYAGNVGTYARPGSTAAVWFNANATGTIIAGATISSNTAEPVKPQVSLSSILDGTSNTFLVGEKHVPFVGLYTVNYGDASVYNGYWVPFRCRLAGLEDPLALGPNDVATSARGDSQWARKFGSWHPGVCGFAFCDGSVRYIRNSTGGTMLERASSRSDGQVVTF